MNPAGDPRVVLGVTSTALVRRPPARPPAWKAAVPPMTGAASAASAGRPAARWRRRWWAWARTLAGVAILASLAWQLGTGGFLTALRVIDAGTLLATAALGLLTTVLSAWRWCLVARGLGIALSLRTATADCYRAAFLNVALPGGVVGDVHRAVRHGRDLGDLGLGVRAVALERFAGQAVAATTGVAILLVLPSPARPALTSLPAGLTAGLAAGAVAAVVVAALLARGALRRATSRWVRALRTGVVALRCGLLARRAWPGVVVASVGVFAGYLGMFLVAARAAGTTAPTRQLLPLLVLALLAMAVPLNVGGWGPREGVCAWAFAVAGLGASQGLTVAVVYGLSVFAASLPGAGVLLVRWLARRRADRAAPETGAASRPAARLRPAGLPTLDQTVPYRSESA